MGRSVFLVFFSVMSAFANAKSAQILNFEPLATPDWDDVEYLDDETNTSAQINLGKILFFDKRLSINNQQSCATCHDPLKGFGDGMALGVGTKNNPLGRNTPHLYNLAWNVAFMWDGREASLEHQALGPIKSAAEMMLPIAVLSKRLQAVPYYRRQFKEVYQVDKISGVEIGHAIAAFERTIAVTTTPFDRYLAGQESAMSVAAINGLTLFKGKGRCVACHDGANFTDNSFYNIGVSNDLGRGKVVKDASLNHAFKTPGLRNTALTAPYMHDGSLKSLEEVIEFYNQGGGEYGKVDSNIIPLELSEQEKADLLAFLNALTAPVVIDVPIVP